MRTIVIKLCDNDFGNTFRNLLSTVYRLIVFKEGLVSEELVRNSILEGIRFHYLYFQSDWDSESDEKSIKTCNNLGNKIKIYFDAEAEQIIENFDDDGGSWYLEIQTGKIYSF